MRRLHAVSMVGLVAAGMVVTLAARTPQGTPVDLLITRARVVDTRSGAITPGRVIAIRGDTIVAIGDSAEGSRFRARQVIDAAGRHVIPGLWDMHMHFGGGDTLIPRTGCCCRCISRTALRRFAMRQETCRRRCWPGVIPSPEGRWTVR